MLLVASSCHGNRRKSRGNCSIVDRECSAADPSPAPVSRCSTSGVQDDTSLGESLEPGLQHGQGSISRNGSSKTESKLEFDSRYNPHLFSFACCPFRLKL